MREDLLILGAGLFVLLVYGLSMLSVVVVAA